MDKDLDGHCQSVTTSLPGGEEKDKKNVLSWVHLVNCRVALSCGFAHRHAVIPIRIFSSLYFYPKAWKLLVIAGAQPIYAPHEAQMGLQSLAQANIWRSYKPQVHRRVR